MATTVCTLCGHTCSKWPHDIPSALVHYRAAAARTTSIPEQRYLTAKAARLHHHTRN